MPFPSSSPKNGPLSGGFGPKPGGFKSSSPILYGFLPPPPPPGNIQGFPGGRLISYSSSKPGGPSGLLGPYGLGFLGGIRNGSYSSLPGLRISGGGCGLLPSPLFSGLELEPAELMASVAS